MVLDYLKPGADVEYLSIDNYGGMRLPSWMKDGINYWLPNLVEIRIVVCKECINMGSFGRLRHLKVLKLKRLDKAEYIENGSSNESDMVVLADKNRSAPLFPSLVTLILIDIPELKGWWNVTDSAEDQTQNQLQKRRHHAFPILERVTMDMELVISLAVFLQGISSLQGLTVFGKTKIVAEQTCGPKQRQPVILLKDYLPRLCCLSFMECQMKHLPEEFRGMSSLKTLDIVWCEALEAVPEWIDSLASLEFLSIRYCPRLKSLPREMSNLSNLKTLLLDKCSSELVERCQSPSGEDWPKIQHIPKIRIEPATDSDESRS